MEVKENQRVALTKRLLQEGLLRLLKQKSLSKINVSELCREAGINRTTFYKHYGAPYDVLAEIEEQFIHGLLETQKNKKHRGTLVLQKHLEDICIYLYKHADLVKILIASNMDSDILNIFDDLLKKENNVYKHLEKRFDRDSLRLVSTFIGNGGHSLIQQWLMEDIPKTPKEIAALIFEISTKGWF